MGAIAVREGVYFEAGDHGTTFGGSPLACAAALASIEAIRADGLIKKSETTGRYLMEKLSQLGDIGGHNIVEVRGKGLMIGVECADGCGDIVDKAREAGIIVNVTDGNVVRFVPPLVITKEQVGTVVDVLADI
ncbi:MAG: aminotransferase class III-fold pyridoxal phosphate-dependent enzyme, partial [Methanosarcinales archaeon]|nr:aminotransferase class III-fold pyridoxal phosphate-dependent enzyme [Methanosarcinales archaeon]